MLISKEVEVTLVGANAKYYEDKGYKIPKRKNKYGKLKIIENTKIKVKVEDLPKNSNVKIQVKCDGNDCENPYLKPMKWQAYKKYVHKNGKYYCNKCGINLIAKENMKKTKLKHGQSFYDWCCENLNKEEADKIISRWDTEKNKCSPKNINHGSEGINRKGYYFKCLNHPEHGSELKSIASFIRGHKGSIICKKCNSIGQYIIDTYGKDGLNIYWDYDKNNKLDLDPWKISKGSNKKVYIFCQEHKYHGSYKVICSHFVHGNKCPRCHGRSICKKDSLGQYIIDNYGQKFLNKVWSSKNKKSPFEYAPNAHQEVWWNCLDDKHSDYKRNIKDSKNYNFRCPQCVIERDESILQEKTRKYLESLGYNVLHEYNCTLVPKNPKTKMLLPFDNEIILKNGNHLICEVHGKQHYSKLNGFYQLQAKRNNTTSEYEFHKQQLHDRYKKIYAKLKGYKYLAIPYWTDNEKEDYKKLINNKLNEIGGDYNC